MDKKRQREKAAELLRGYKERQTVIKVLQIDIETLQKLQTPSVKAAVCDGLHTGKTNRIASPVEAEALQGEKRQEQIRKIERQIGALQLKNQEIDIVLEALPELYRAILRLRYIEGRPWVQVGQRCSGYSEEYIRADLNRKALDEFAEIYYGAAEI